MIPSPSEPSVFPGAAMPPIAPGTAATGAAAVHDFAGLLGAALLPGGKVPMAGAATADGLPGTDAVPAIPGALLPFTPVPMPLGELIPLAQATPSGSIVPADGTVLPPPGGMLPQGDLLPEAGLFSAAPAPATPRPAQEPVGFFASQPAGDDEGLPDPGTPAGVVLLAAAPLPVAVPVPVSPPAPPAVRHALVPSERAAASAGIDPEGDLPAFGQPAGVPAGADRETASSPASVPPSEAGAGAAVNLLPAATATSGAGLPEAPASAVSQSAPLPAAPAERTEMRGPAAQLDSAIAQVGEIREALRAVRPELTVRNADFGLVSLRLEAPALAAAVQDWRAVLSSRDPAFVPAVHAALTDRGVAPAADAAATGSGAGQGGGSGSFTASDKPYGFSQGSGQGASQPYPDQSGRQGGDAAPDPQDRHRRAGEAAPAEPQDGASGTRRDGGLFA